MKTTTSRIRCLTCSTPLALIDARFSHEEAMSRAAVLARKTGSRVVILSDGEDLAAVLRDPAGRIITP